MREIVLTFAGEKITVIELSARKNSEWRKQLDAPFKAMLEALKATDTQINSMADIPNVMARLQDLLIPNADIIPDIVISYSPVLEALRAWLDENATETEFLNAFLQIARVAYPTDFFMQQAAAMKQLGSAKPPTLTS